MPAEGRWTTWSDEEDAPHVARLDVPGNEALEADFLASRPRRPTHEELLRSIQWTDAHPEWLQQVEQERAELDRTLEDLQQRADAEAAAARTGPRLYFDSRTGNIEQAAEAPDPKNWWRLVMTVDEAWASLLAGEPAAVVPSNFTQLDPGTQLRVLGDSINDQYEKAVTLPDETPAPADPERARFRQQLERLQQHWRHGWGTDLPEEAVPGPESKVAPGIQLAGGATDEDQMVRYNDMLGRAFEGVPSQGEGEIGVPRFDPFAPDIGYPLRRFGPPTLPTMPRIPPGILGRPGVGTVAQGPEQPSLTLGPPNAFTIAV